MTSPADTAAAALSTPPPTTRAAAEKEESSQQQPCWICHDRRGTLMSNFCGCQGSLGHVHQSCLQTFVDQKEGDSGERDVCPTCKQPYSFVFFSKDGKPPPEVPKSPIASWFKQQRFLIQNFYVPACFDFTIAVLEFTINWVIPSFLLGAIMFIGRSLAIEYWTSPRSSSSSLIITKAKENDELYSYDYDARYMRDNTCMEAIIIGSVLLALRRRIKNGWFQIIQETNPRNTAAAAAAARNAAANTNTNNAGAAVNNNNNDVNNHNDDADENVAPDGGLLPPAADEEDENNNNNDDEFEQFEDDDDEEEEEEGEVIEQQVGQDGEPIEQQQQIGVAAAAGGGRRRRRRRKGGKTLDQVVWKLIELLQTASRYPYSGTGNKRLLPIYETYTNDLPYMLVAMFTLTAIPPLFFIYHAYHVIHSYFTKIPPKLEDLKQRYEEGGRRLRSESTDDDRERYYLIYCYDATLLYLLLSLTCGIVAHEALGVTRFTINAAAAGSSTSSSSSPSPDAASASAVILNPLTTITHGILPRIFHIIHNPWNSVFHWLFGYLIAGAITALESQIITPVFAAGCSLIFFRSINISDEHATFRFMLIQLFDVNIYHGLAHCVKLFATYIPLIFTALWSLVNSLRFSTALGAVLSAKIDALLFVAGGGSKNENGGGILSTIDKLFWSVFDGSINDHFAAMMEDFNNKMTEKSSSSSNYYDTFTSAVSQLAHFLWKDIIQETYSVVVASSPSGTPAVGSYNQSFLSITSSFWNSIILVAVAGTTLYFLPYQYMILRRFLPFGKFLAERMSLSKFLFDETQMATVDHFMEVSSQLPVKGDNVVELPAANIPIGQTAIRRERFVEKEDIPSWHNVRIFFFMIALFLKGFVDWVWEVCRPWILYSMVAVSMSDLNEMLPENNKFTTMSWLQMLRLTFDPFLYLVSLVSTSLSSLFVSLINYVLGASLFDEILANEQLMMNNSNNNNVSSSSSSLVDVVSSSVMNNATSIANIISNNNSKLIFTSTEYGLNGLFLISTALVFCLAHYPSELATSLGYVLVTPVALVMSLYELIKPAIEISLSAEAMNSFIESVWRSAFGIRRVVVPKPEGWRPEIHTNHNNKRSTSALDTTQQLAELLTSELKKLEELNEKKIRKLQGKETREKRGLNVDELNDDDHDNDNNDNDDDDGEEYDITESDKVIQELKETLIRMKRRDNENQTIANKSLDEIAQSLLKLHEKVQKEGKDYNEENDKKRKNEDDEVNKFRDID